MYERVPNPTVVLISRISCNQATVDVGASIATVITWTGWALNAWIPESIDVIYQLNPGVPLP
jgi:hypothetical protein